MKDKSIKIIPIPVYSKIKVVNGRIIAVVEDSLDTPIEWLEEDENGKGIRKTSWKE